MTKFPFALTVNDPVISNTRAEKDFTKTPTEAADVLKEPLALTLIEPSNIKLKSSAGPGLDELASSQSRFPFPVFKYILPLLASKAKEPEGRSSPVTVGFPVISHIEISFKVICPKIVAKPHPPKIKKRGGD